MTNSNKPINRDEVLFAFHEAYQTPTAAQVAKWVAKYPEYADDIIAHAAISYDWVANKDRVAEEPSKSDLDAAFSRVLSVMYEAERNADEAAAKAGETLSDIARVRGKDVRAIHREIEMTHHIERGILADLFNGIMLPPLSKRFSTSVCHSLDVPVPRFNAAYQQTLRGEPRMSFANARAAPTIMRRTCEEIFRSSDMTPEEIQYWLDEDI